VAANIYIFCSAGVDELIRWDLEEKLKVWLRRADEDFRAGVRKAEYNLHYEVREGHYAVGCAARVKAFLADKPGCPGTVLELFPDGWERGKPWLRLEVFGADRWVTEQDLMPCLASEVKVLKESQSHPFDSQTLRAALNVLEFLDQALFGTHVWQFPRGYYYDITAIGSEQLCMPTESEQVAAFANDVASGWLDELCEVLDLERAARIRSELEI
jgi:hypothetical protein